MKKTQKKVKCWLMVAKEKIYDIYTSKAIAEAVQRDSANFLIMKHNYGAEIIEGTISFSLPTQKGNKVTKKK